MDRKRFAVDAVALAVYLVAANPAVTGIAVHEWLGIGALVLFLAHCAQHVDWIASTARGLRGSTWAARGNLALDALVLVAFMAVTVSGLLISGEVLPAFGLYADGYYFWDPLHAISAKALLALLLVHVVVHWKWLYGLVRKGRGGHDE
ncbi:DUF4405 domain-containing protein [Raoultibacter phocaeensis]|uniref:DUF4405 domain-containing protein n=1 Tax=Raoultibacter phocaeensis TaxID=2479841 RepID=UPI00111AC69C|nr:DUF4405 domain-containing protein [Raoultibacter phocaeensis]